MSKADFYDYWLNQHGPLATELVKKLGAYRYVQSHTNNQDLGILLAKSRGQLGPLSRT
ncbi:EthD domain-containing protein [Streptomyces sp. DT2A-34]|uniref:EthD domain-containing protein n=1 Tax=Streptomyces sp. DT2A-34 TaxID=3051182 RepID=UPI0034645CD2